MANDNLSLIHILFPQRPVCKANNTVSNYSLKTAIEVYRCSKTLKMFTGEVIECFKRPTKTDQFEVKPVVSK